MAAVHQERLCGRQLDSVGIDEAGVVIPEVENLAQDLSVRFLKPKEVAAHEAPPFRVRRDSPSPRDALEDNVSRRHGRRLERTMRGYSDPSPERSVGMAVVLTWKWPGYTKENTEADHAAA